MNVRRLRDERWIKCCKRHGTQTCVIMSTTTLLRQQEIEVLSHFEEEIERLEDDVRRSIVFYSTKQRYIDTECLMDQQSHDDVKSHIEGSPANKNPSNTSETDSKLCLVFSNDSSTKGLRQQESLNLLHGNTRDDVANSNARSRYRHDNDDGTNDEQLHVGSGLQVEAGGDDPCQNTFHRQPDNQHHDSSSPNYAYNVHDTSSLKTHQNGVNTDVPKNYRENNERVYSDSVRVKKKQAKVYSTH